MLLNLLRSGGNSTAAVICVFSSIFVAFCTMPIHEFAHAFTATKLGDDTARLKGRLTLNPLAHIDWIGAIMIVLVGFGYAKPVPVNARNFKNPRLGMALTALAGPVSNILMANVFMILRNAFVVFGAGGSTLSTVCVSFFYFAAYINVSLAVFNILPIPPLDGSRVFNLLIPKKYYFKIMQYERYIIYAVFILIFIGVLDRPLSFLTRLFMTLITAVTSLPFPGL